MSCRLVLAGSLRDAFGDLMRFVIETSSAIHSLRLFRRSAQLFQAGCLLFRGQNLAVGDLPAAHRQNILDLARAVTKKLKVFGRDLFIFEHGPSKPLSAMGCGIDQSHLHAVAMDGNLLNLVLADDSVIWTNAPAHDPWSKCRGGQEYLFIGSSDDCYVGLPRTAQSQYFRRKIAQLEGMPDAWDYREWPWYENAQRTTEHFAAARPRRAA